jgi:hypothetical protein
VLIEAFGKCLHKLHLKIGSIFEVLLEFRELSASLSVISFVSPTTSVKRLLLSSPGTSTQY